MSSSVIRSTRPKPEPQTSQISVAVIGGGIGGFAAALSMLRAGLDVHVYEQARELRETGAGIQVSPNATRILNRSTEGRIALPVSGDDLKSKQVVMAILDEIGFDAVDAGPLSGSWRYQHGFPHCILDSRLCGLSESTSS
jgi:NADPH-dependent 2,4-dienoyl-CoA reductase/sulfur reductase-like enzyme